MLAPQTYDIPAPQAQVLAKSTKMVPVMLVGTLLHRKRYSAFEYVCMSLIGAGVGLFARKSSSKVRAAGGARRLREGPARLMPLPLLGCWGRGSGGRWQRSQHSGWGAFRHRGHPTSVALAAQAAGTEQAVLLEEARGARSGVRAGGAQPRPATAAAAPSGHDKAGGAQRAPGLHPVLPEPLPGRIHKRRPGAARRGRAPRHEHRRQQPRRRRAPPASRTRGRRLLTAAARCIITAGRDQPAAPGQLADAHDVLDELLVHPVLWGIHGRWGPEALGPRMCPAGWGFCMVRCVSLWCTLCCCCCHAHTHVHGR